jgi:hypothetical protein
MTNRYTYIIDYKGRFNIIEILGASRQQFIAYAVSEIDATLIVSALNTVYNSAAAFNQASDRLAWKNGDILAEYDHFELDINNAEKQ